MEVELSWFCPRYTERDAVPPRHRADIPADPGEDALAGVGDADEPGGDLPQMCQTMLLWMRARVRRAALAMLAEGIDKNTKLRYRPSWFDTRG